MQNETPPSRSHTAETLEELTQLLRALGVENTSEVMFVRRPSKKQFIRFISETGNQENISVDDIDLIEAQEATMLLTGFECLAAGQQNGIYISLLGR